MRLSIRNRAGGARLRRSVAVLVTAVLGSAGLAAVSAAPASAAPACQVTYTKASDWGTGFSVNISIVNNGPAISSWTLAYSYTGNQTLQNGWSGNWTQSGENVTVTNASWNGSIATGASVSLGANFNYTGTNTTPTAFSLNGTACNGSSTTGTPTVSLTSPANNATFTAPANISLAASASETGGTISKVEFFQGTTLLGTSTTSPYTFTWSNVPAGTYSLTAEAFDASGQMGTSSAVSVSVTAPTTPSVEISPSTLTVLQGSTGTLGVSLSSAPTSNVTVAVANTAGNTGLSVSKGASLTFTPSNWQTAQTVTIAADASSTGNATITASAAGFTSASATVTEQANNNPPPTGGLVVSPSTFQVQQGTTDDFGVSLSAAPTANVTVTVGETAGNAGESVTAGTTLTFTPSNWNYAQPVAVTGDASSTGAATFTVASTGMTSVTTTGTEVKALTGSMPTHVADPFTGSTWYVNPDYTKEVQQSSSTASGTLAAQMNLVGQQSTGVWLDRIAAIYGGTGNSARMSLEAHLQTALTQASGSTPILVPLVIYDLPNRDCAALASNGELSVNNNGLTYYENDYINPIAQILSNYQKSNIRIVAIVEPDSLPNLATNLSDANCSQAQSSGAYVNGIDYALNKLHAMPNVYTYLDIGHSGWLGWSSNVSKAIPVYQSVAQGATAGFSAVDGFISDTANTIPYKEPYMTATEQEDGNPVDSVQFYSFDPMIDEQSYDENMYSQFVSAGFNSTIGMLVDTSRDGWGGPLRPTGPCTTCTTTASFVNASKIDQRPFRGDWCNPNGAGIGAFPQANPDSSFSHLYAFIWIKPPGESDGDYPTATHTHGDPHCDPNGTQTDGNGNSYPTDAIPGFDIPAGNWFPAQFQQLVTNAFPAIP